jgi:phage major head subunit gpT-like protein
MSSTPLILRNNFSDLFSASALPALEELFRHELQMHPMIREQLCRVVSTDKDIYQSSEIGDLENFKQVDEGTDYSFVAPRQGADKTFVIKKYGLGFTISEEAVEDGKFDMIAMAVKMLAESAIESQEVSAMNLFNQGFSSAVTTRDGLSLFNTAHTLPSGLTYRNRPATHVDLSQSSLDAALVDFETQFIRDSGKIVNMSPSILLVPPQLKRYAMELVGSDLKPDTSDNNMNSLKQEGLRVVSSPRLTDPDAWFLLAPPEKNGLRIIKRKGIETKAAGPDAGFVNDSIMYKSRYREDVGALDAIGAWGTEGA